MKKMMMTLAAVLCCAMFVTVSMTSCAESVDDNPVITPEPKPVAMADVLKIYTVPQSFYELDTKELLPTYVVVNSAYEDEQGETKFYDLSTITSVSCLYEGEKDMFTIDATQLADHGYIKLIPNMENQEIQFFVEDMELTQLAGSMSYSLVLTNSSGEKLQADLMLSYVYITEIELKEEIKLADLDKDNKYTIDLPDELKYYKLDEWPFNRKNDFENMVIDYLFGAEVVGNKLTVITDGQPTEPGDPNKLTYTFSRRLTGSPYPMLPEGEGLMVNYRIKLELTVNQ